VEIITPPFMAEITIEKKPRALAMSGVESALKPFKV
jgi:hypothetical protein